MKQLPWKPCRVENVELLSLFPPADQSNPKLHDECPLMEQDWKSSFVVVLVLDGYDVKIVYSTWFSRQGFHGSCLVVFKMASLDRFCCLETKAGKRGGRMKRRGSQLWEDVIFVLVWFLCSVIVLYCSEASWARYVLFFCEIVMILLYIRERKKR